MFFNEWARWLRRLAQQVRGKPGNRAGRRVRPKLESLEERITPSAQWDSGGAQGQYTASDMLSYHGGAFDQNVTVEPIFLKDTTSGRFSPNQATLDAYFNDITSGQYIATQLAELSTGLIWSATVPRARTM